MRPVFLDILLCEVRGASYGSDPVTVEYYEIKQMAGPDIT